MVSDGGDDLLIVVAKGDCRGVSLVPPSCK